MRGATPPIGTLRDRVQLQSRQTSSTDDGGHEAIFVPLGSVWARVRSRAGRFAEESDGRTGRATHEVTLRFRKDIGPGDRIVYRGRALEIASVEDINGRRAYLACQCVESAMVG
ncbi:phage head closure protein [Pelagibacterium montanilacus]|uniref:phage head closure protein n=1 Tax=Pelagibacterium montanilacus TaxID=2185280 RepID=UPI0013E0504E|nr:phage head closure protein [Pelagibacterium montanilacus]